MDSAKLCFGFKVAIVTHSFSRWQNGNSAALRTAYTYYFLIVHNLFWEGKNTGCNGQDIKKDWSWQVSTKLTIEQTNKGWICHFRKYLPQYDILQTVSSLLGIANVTEVPSVWACPACVWHMCVRGRYQKYLETFSVYLLA